MRVLVNMSDVICAADTVHLLLVKLILSKLVPLRSHSTLIAIQYFLVVYVWEILLWEVVWVICVDTKFDR